MSSTLTPLSVNGWIHATRRFPSYALTISLILLGLAFPIACGGGGGNSSAGTPAPVIATPTSLTAIGSDGQVALSWNASAGATNYHVKRGPHGGPYSKIGEPSATNYTDAGRTNGTTYYYVISAVNSTGESADTSEVLATPATGLPILPESDPKKNSIGMNTWLLNDWDASYAFVDAMKHAREWEADWNQPAVSVDTLGWPTTDASTVVFTCSAKSDELDQIVAYQAQVNRTFKLVFNGKADVSVRWVPGSITNQVYTPATNTTTADVTFAVTTGGPVGLIFSNTQRKASSATHTGFTNVRLYRPGYPTDGSVVFTTPFLNALGKTSVVRMMDWTETNQNLVQHWADRMTPLHMSDAKPTYMRLDGSVLKSDLKNVALEHQIQLANALHSDCWINIPVVADDDYVQKVALALRYGTDGTHPYTSHQANPVYPPLDPSLRIYVEYANEIWNFAGGFYCFPVIRDIVNRLPADHILPRLAPVGSDEYELLFRYPAYRIAVISDTFRSVYGDASMMNRVRPVLMTQIGNAHGTLSNALLWLSAYGHTQSPSREVSSYLYGAGGSGYYGVNVPPSVADQGNADLFFATGNYPDTQGVKAMGLDAVIAANSGLKRIAYEGGQGLDGYTPQNARAINADPRMQDMVVKTHDAWSNQGGDLLVYYTLVHAYAWEFTPDITKADTPKLKALDQLKAQPRAAVTLGQQLPGSIIAADPSMDFYRLRNGNHYIRQFDGLDCVGGLETSVWIALTGHASTALTGTIVVNGMAYSTTTMNVFVNGVNKGQVTLVPNGNHITNSTSLSGVAIPAGLVVVRLEVVSGDFMVRSVTIN